MKREEIRLSGFGGQGIILAGHIIGKAVTIYEGRYATLTQSYGPESRGGACSAQLMIGDEPIQYPRLIQPQILVVMSQEAYHKYRDEMVDGVALLIDSDLVHTDDLPPGVRLLGIPATRFAEELGRRIVSNVVMLGFFAAVTDVVSREALLKATLDSVKKGTEDLNTRAFERGYEYGRGLVTGVAT